MTGGRGGRSRLPWLVAAGVALLASSCCLGLVVVVAAAVGSGTPAVQAGDGSRLRPDAPVPPQYLALLLAAGSLCPQIGPAEIAAQLDLESSWNPNAYADSGEVPAKGIAQFTDATWKTWGRDYDHDGTNSPYDPGDAIIAQGHLMCDLVRWAQRQVGAGRLRGNLLDLAWAAYFCGRGCVLAASGVPAAGLAHDYPQQVRSRLPKYAAAPVASGGWTLPLARGTYSVGSGFGPRWGRLHAGVDLTARTGTPIYAAAAGVVLSASCTSAYCDRPITSRRPGGSGYPPTPTTAAYAHTPPARSSPRHPRPAPLDRPPHTSQPAPPTQPPRTDHPAPARPTRRPVPPRRTSQPARPRRTSQPAPPGRAMASMCSLPAALHRARPARPRPAPAQPARNRPHQAPPHPEPHQRPP